MAYRSLARTMSALGTSLLLSVGIVACSLTSLDGFTSGGAAPDGGRDEAGSDASATDGANPEGGLSTDPYGDEVRADRPAAWWRFEDAEGSPTLQDEMGAHHAQVTPRKDGKVTIQFGAPGVSGRAAKLGNQAGFFRVGDVFDFAGQAELALEAWVSNESPAAEYETIFAKRSEDDDGTANAGWIVYIHKPGQGLGFQLWKDHAVSAATSFEPLTAGFHHLVITGTKKPDGMAYTMFYDGEPRDTDAKNPVDQLDTSAGLALGFGWNGSLDEIAIYEHSLTPERVLAHYKAAKP